MKRGERLCSCGQRAVYRSPSRGMIYDPEHVLCLRCYRAQQDRLRPKPTWPSSSS